MPAEAGSPPHAVRRVRLDVTTEMFSGTQAGGDWVLRVADTAGSDTGRLVRWSVTLL